MEKTRVTSGSVMKNGTPKIGGESTNTNKCMVILNDLPILIWESQPKPSFTTGILGGGHTPNTIIWVGNDTCGFGMVFWVR